MATVNKNLSDYNIEDVPSAKDMKFGVVVSEWNENITESLFKGAIDALLNCGCKESNIIRKNVPGSFELPLGAQFFFESTDVDAVICLGSVIQGETKHFDFISFNKYGIITPSQVETFFILIFLRTFTSRLLLID